MGINGISIINGFRITPQEKYKMYWQNYKELYFEKGSPVLYPYGMWADILKAGIEDPGLQELIDKMIMYYNLSKE